jgi:hypothetical protein
MGRKQVYSRMWVPAQSFAPGTAETRKGLLDFLEEI